jgi:hypothetical protein
MRKNIRAQREECRPVEVATTELANIMQEFRYRHFGGHNETSRPLEEKINEAYLWHGTKYENVEHIFSQDFRMGRKALGFFGKGLYFAESCAKADEYAGEHEHIDGWYCEHSDKSVLAGKRVCVMLLCRVVLGQVDVEEREGSYSQKVGTPKTHTYDSLFGEREFHRREVIVYHEKAVFPEFAVFYTREYQQATSNSLEECMQLTRSHSGLPEPAAALEVKKSQAILRQRTSRTVENARAVQEVRLHMPDESPAADGAGTRQPPLRIPSATSCGCGAFLSRCCSRLPRVIGST